MTRTQKQITRRHKSAPASDQEVRSLDRNTLRRAEKVMALIDELISQRR